MAAARRHGDGIKRLTKNSTFNRYKYPTASALASATRPPAQIIQKAQHAYYIVYLSPDRIVKALDKEAL